MIHFIAIVNFTGEENNGHKRVRSKTSFTCVKVYPLAYPERCHFRVTLPHMQMKPKKQRTIE